MTKLLLASDFDGTVAPIQRDPETVKIDSAARMFFAWAADQEDVEVAFISGRDLADLRSRTSGIEAWRSGSHGQEIESPAGVLISSAKEREDDPPPEWESRAAEAGVRLERKKFGVAVHWRDVEGISGEHPLIAEFAEWARSKGLETTHGRCVLEAAVPGASKKQVLERLIRETGAEVVIYAGDDVTDLDAIELAAEQGCGLFVRSREREVTLGENVEIVDSTDQLLARMKEEVVRLQD